MNASPHQDRSPDGSAAAEEVAPLGARALDDATRQLREQPPPPRAVEIADRVLQLSLRTPRPATLVRGRGATSFLRVSSLHEPLTFTRFAHSGCAISPSPDQMKRALYRAPFIWCG